MRTAMMQHDLSARIYRRILKPARIIAGLDVSEKNPIRAFGLGTAVWIEGINKIR